MTTMTFAEKAKKAGRIRTVLRAARYCEAYRIYNPIWAIALEDIPPNLRPGLIRHVLVGQPTGGFLASLLANDLHDAVIRADPASLANLRALCIFLYNFTPRLCHGSTAALMEWRAKGGSLGVYYDNADLEAIS